MQADRKKALTAVRHRSAIDRETGKAFPWSGKSVRQPSLQTAAADQPRVAAALRWRSASNRQTPVATDTLRLLTLPAIGNRTR